MSTHEPHSDDCQVHVVSRVHDHLVQVREGLLSSARTARTAATRDRLTHEAQGVAMAISALREEMST